MQNRFLTYNEVLEETKDSKRFLLLGNGFSMAYNFERFSFTSLQESAVEKGYIKKDSPVYKIFENFKTKDFEEVVKLLETSIEICKVYGLIGEKESVLIQNDANKLKEHLVDIITNNHPAKITEITDDEFMNSANFIKNYDRVYTLNYDLLLYWTTIKLDLFYEENRIKDKKLKIQDGFFDPDEGNTDYVTYSNSSSKNKPNIFYLHGALHIFDKKYKIIKNTYRRTNKALREQTLENLNNEIYPIFVSEGTSEQKKSKILHNAYLNHCYRSLKSIGSIKKEDSLIIFGTMLKTNDEHIQDAIMENNVKNIYIGVSSKDNIPEFAPFVERANKRYKKVYFYDYRSVQVWR
jgi:hypothetical protein